MPLTLSSLPLFPLATVLFPQGQLPLRVFEVRYLDMVAKCHQAGAPFGVVSLLQGSEVRKPQQVEVFSDVGTLATIERLNTPRPGLMEVYCSGAQRFHVLRRQQLRNGLWVADVEHIGGDNRVLIPTDLAPVAQALERVLDKLRPESLERPNAPPLLDDCAWVANRWCELLPLPLSLKQHLLELESPLIRLELVSDFLHRAGIV